jgi:hypothetical protein
MESDVVNKHQGDKFNLRSLVKPLRRYIAKKLYSWDIYVYFLYPNTEKLITIIQSRFYSNKLATVVSDIKSLAAERGWLFKICQPTTIQQCEASRTIVEDTWDIVKHGRLRVNQSHSSRLYHSRERGEMYYSHLYATVRYPVYETFKCEIPGATILSPTGVAVTSQLEALAASTTASPVELSARVPFLLSSSSSPVQMAGTYVSLVGVYSQGNYAHWLMDYLPRLALLEPSDTEFKVIVDAYPERYRIDSLKLLGISEERVVEMKQKSIYVEKLILCHAAQRLGVPSAVHLHNIRDRLVSAVIGSRYSSSPNRRIYISRAKSSRKIVNENELLPILLEYNFEVVFCEELSLQEQIRLFSESNVVMGAHGAGVFNHIFCNPGATVIEIYNRQRWEHAPRKLASLMNHKHWHIFGEQVDNDWNTWLDPRKLQKVLAYALEESPLKEGALHEEVY